VAGSPRRVGNGKNSRASDMRSSERYARSATGSSTVAEAAQASDGAP